jgi:hypothetical protein
MSCYAITYVNHDATAFGTAVRGMHARQHPIPNVKRVNVQTEREARRQLTLTIYKNTLVFSLFSECIFKLRPFFSYRSFKIRRQDKVNLRYLLTGIRRSFKVSKSVSKFLFEAYKTPIQNIVLFYGITMTSVSRE